MPTDDDVPLTERLNHAQFPQGYVPFSKYLRACGCTCEGLTAIRHILLSVDASVADAGRMPTAAELRLREEANLDAVCDAIRDGHVCECGTIDAPGDDVVIRYHACDSCGNEDPLDSTGILPKELDPAIWPPVEFRWWLAGGRPGR